MSKPIFHTYMLTNFEKTVLYTGFTNNLPIRLVEHWLGLKKEAFTNHYNVHYLLWFEETKYVLNAIAKEKELKTMSRDQKEELIRNFNPDWRFLNEEVSGNWPPAEEQILFAKGHADDRFT